MPSSSQPVRNFLAIDERERHDMNFLASGAARHISEFPRKLVKLMEHHHTRVHDLFNMLDADNDGEVTLQEFMYVLDQLGVADISTKEDMQQLFDAVDQDKKGSITFDELDLMWKMTRRGKDIMNVGTVKAGSIKNGDQKSDAESGAEKSEAAIKREEAAKRKQAAAAAAAAKAIEQERIRMEAEAEKKAEREKELAQAAEEQHRLQEQWEAHAHLLKETAKAEAERNRLADEEHQRYLARALADLRASMTTQKSKSSQDTTRQPWNHHTRPRGERVMHKRLDMYHRAKPDVRPASIAFPLETEASLLAHSQTAANLARAASSDFIRYVQPPRVAVTPHRIRTLSSSQKQLSSSVGLIATGVRRIVLSVKRVSADHFVFTPVVHKGHPLDPGPRAILDSDSVDVAIAKLQKRFHEELPEEIPFAPSSSATRQVLVVLRCNRAILDQSRSIGEQCLETNYKPLALWRPEHSESRMPSVNWGSYATTISERCSRVKQRKDHTPAPFRHPFDRPASAPVLRPPEWRAPPQSQPPPRTPLKDSEKKRTLARADVTLPRRMGYST